MGMMETINKFVDTMLEEQQGFETMQNEVSKKEEDVLQELKNLEYKEALTSQLKPVETSGQKRQHPKGVWIEKGKIVANQTMAMTMDP